MNRSDIACCLCSSSDHLSLADEQDRARRDRRRAAHAERLTGQAALAEEVAGAEHRHDGLFAGLRQHRQLDAARLDVQDVVAGSPCVKMASPRPYSTTVLAMPAESRNACALNSGSVTAAFATFGFVSFTSTPLRRWFSMP